MATTADNALFLDTNVLIYASVAEAPNHADCVASLKRWRQAETKLIISRQVLREFMATLSRPQSFMQPIPIENIVRMVEAYQRLLIVCDDNALVSARLLQIVAETPVGGKQIHDANIVATMLAHGLSTLVTYNTDDFRRFTKYIRVITPVPLS